MAVSSDFLSDSKLFVFVKGFLAGGAAAAVSKTSVAPIDRVKLLLQLQDSQTIAPIGHRRYHGMVDCFRRVAVEQGRLSFWRGNMATVIRSFPSNAFSFAFRDQFRYYFVDGVDKSKHFYRFVIGNIAAGGFAGAATTSLLYPLDFARTRLAVDVGYGSTREFRGLYHCMASIVGSSEGVCGLYRGFLTSIQFVIISRATFFGLFDTSRGMLTKDETKTWSFAANWILAQSCIMVSSFTCYPLDSVRRRLMMQSGKKHKQYRNSIDCWRSIIQYEGFGGFYKGALTNTLRSSSGALIVALYYEFIKYI